VRFDLSSEHNLPGETEARNSTRGSARDNPTSDRSHNRSDSVVNVFRVLLHFLREFTGRSLHHAVFYFRLCFPSPHERNFFFLLCTLCSPKCFYRDRRIVLSCCCMLATVRNWNEFSVSFYRTLLLFFLLYFRSLPLPSQFLFMRP